MHTNLNLNSMTVYTGPVLLDGPSDSHKNMKDLNLISMTV